MFKYFMFLYSFVLMGCAATLVPESSDPKTKIHQATVLFNQQGRPAGAVSLLKQAIPLAQKENDKESEADAEFYLAEIYKAPGPNGVDLKNPLVAVHHYKRALVLYDHLKLYKRSSFVSWNMAGAYEMLPDEKSKCQTLRDAQRSHERAGGSSKDVLPPPYSGGNLLKSIQHQLKKNKC